MKLFIGGDITPTQITSPVFDRGDLDALFGTVTALTRTGDAFIANLECALTDSDTPIRKCGPNLRGRPAYARLLKEFGLTAVGLSNNHVFDFGQPGLRETLASLDAAGLPWTGIGEDEQDARKPLFLEAAGKCVAFLCVAEHEYSYALPKIGSKPGRVGVWGFDPFQCMEYITLAKEKADYVIVLYHGGKEQCRYPPPACAGPVRPWCVPARTSSPASTPTASAAMRNTRARASSTARATSTSWAWWIIPTGSTACCWS